MAISNEELDRSMTSLSQQMKDLGRQMNGLANTLRNNQGAANSYQSSLSSLNQTTEDAIKQKRLEITQLQQNIIQSQESINLNQLANDSLRKRRDSVAEELLATQMNIDRITELANTIQSQINTAKEEQSSRAELANYVESQINVAKQEKLATEERISRIKSANAAIESEIQSTQQKITSNKALTDSLPLQIDIQKSIRAEAGRHIDKLVYLNDSYTSEISAIEKANTQIQAKYKRGQKLSELDQSLLSENQRLLVSAQSRRAANQATIDKELATEKALSSNIQKMEDQLNAVTGQEDELNNKLAELTGALDVNKGTLVKENIQRLGLVESIGSMESELNSVTAEMIGTEYDLKAMSSQITAVGNELADNVAATGDLNSEVFRLTGILAVNEKSVQDEIDKLKELQDAHQRLLKEEELAALEHKKTNNIFKKIQTALNSELMRELIKLADALKRLADTIYATQQRFGVSFDTAATLYTQALLNSAKSFFSAATGKGPFVSTEEILKAGQAFTKQFGTVLQPAEMDRIAKEAKRLGVSSEEYVNAKRAFLGTGGDENAVRTRAMATFAKQGLSAGQAIQFAADNADLLAVAGSKYADSLFRAAAESKKIGVNLRDIEKFANSIVGDFEGSLENFAELSALGVDMDFNQLAQVAATGTTEDMQNLLKEQLSMAGITGEELQTNRQLRLGLTQATGFDESTVLRLAGVAEKPKEATLDERQLAEATETNTLLGQMIEILGSWGGIFSTAAGALGSIAGFVGAAYSFIIAQRIKGVLNDLSGMSGSKLPRGGAPTVPGGGGVGGGGGLSGTASGATSFSQSKVIQGAVAMLVVAASIYVLGKALQQFNTVEWSSLGKAGLMIGALGATVALAGPSIAAGLVALANGVAVAGPLFGAGLAALVSDPRAILGLAAITLAIMGLGYAFQLAAPGMVAFGTMMKSIFDGIANIIGTVTSSFGNLTKTLSGLDAGNIAKVGLSLFPLAGGITALGAAGVIAAPGLLVVSAAKGLWEKLTGKKEEKSPAPAQPNTTVTTQATTTPVAVTTQPPVTPQVNVAQARSPEQKLQPTPQVVAKIDTTRLEEKLDRLINSMRGMRIEMNGYEVGHISQTEVRSPLRTR